MSGRQRRPPLLKTPGLSAALLLACVLVSCGHAPPRYPQVRKPCVVVVMFDLSGSVKEARPDYVRTFHEKILTPDERPYDIEEPINPDLIDAGDTVYVSAINTNPNSDAKAWVNKTLPERVLSDWYLGDPRKDKEKGGERKREVEKEKETIRNTVRQNLATLAPNGTELTGIIASTRNAGEFFRKSDCSATHKCVLVLFTDGIEESKEANFNLGSGGSPPTTVEDVNKLLDTLEREQKLTPGSLKNVDVYVAGATGGSGGGDTSSEFLAIKRFWKAYFERAGARVEEYGNDLIKISLQ